MNKKEEEFDRIYDMLQEGYIPKPVKILIVLVSVLFSPVLTLIDEISKRSENNYE